MGYPARRYIGVLVIVASLLALALPAGAAPAANGGKGKLRQQDREAIAQARTEGKGAVMLLIAAKAGASNSVARDITNLGGTIRYQDNDLDYIRALVPIGKAEAVAALSGIEAVNADEIIPLDDPRPEGTVPGSFTGLSPSG